MPIYTFAKQKYVIKKRFIYQVGGVKYLDFANRRRARIGQVAVVIVNTESAKALRIGGRVAYRVEHLHVADVVQIQALFKAHD